MKEEHQQWMQHALRLAEKAQAQGEVPVGAVLVRHHELIAEGYNQPIESCDPTAHAEMVALRSGAKKIKNYRLLDATLYVTLEPCVMCFSALVHARVKRVIYACSDPKAGAISVFGLSQVPYFNHRFEIEQGVLALECSAMLKDFFLKRRGK